MSTPVLPQYDRAAMVLTVTRVGMVSGYRWTNSGSRTTPTFFINSRTAGSSTRFSLERIQGHATIEQRHRDAIGKTLVGRFPRGRLPFLQDHAR